VAGDPVAAGGPPATDPERAPAPFGVLFVCLGNICRSPTAEGVMRALLAEAGMQREVEVDSAGTGSWHVGSPPDERATAAAAARGIVLQGSARRVQPEDYARFDLIVAMDRENLRNLRDLAPGEPERARLRLLREYDAASAARGELDVPDPYYGAAGGFEEVLDLVTRACQALLAQIRAAGPR
jgi:low molecular weight protein-tyrosine phosphatase